MPGLISTTWMATIPSAQQFLSSSQPGWHLTEEFLRNSNIAARTGSIPNVGHVFRPENIMAARADIGGSTPFSVPAQNIAQWQRVTQEIYLALTLAVNDVPGPYLIGKVWLVRITEEEEIREIARLVPWDGSVAWICPDGRPFESMGSQPLVDMRALVEHCLEGHNREAWSDSSDSGQQWPAE